MADTILEVKNLRKRFGGVEVLKGIDFTLGRGEVLVVIGSSGSGKTTLLRCLNFLERADEGEIAVAGSTVFRAGVTQTDRQIREALLHFGLVFQSFNLFPQYSVLQNVTLAPGLIAAERLREKAKADKSFDFRGEKKKALAEVNRRAEELIRTVGLGDKMQNYPCQLSGGQQQRVAIARALAMSPDVLCFDEPTSALDPELTGEVLRVIRELKSAERTMIVVTHEMEFARGVGDRILFMADGVIEEQGGPEEVFGNPKSPKLRSFLASSNLKG